MKRRHVLELATLLGTWSLLGQEAKAQTAAPILVLIYLGGGNDALNTVVPLNQYSVYQSVRPTLALNRNSLIALDRTVGLSPALSSLLPHYDNGDLALLVGVGVPTLNPSDSLDLTSDTASLFAHDNQRSVWSTGNLQDVGQYGWLGQYLVGQPNLNPLSAFVGTPTLPQMLSAPNFYPAGAVRTLNSYGVSLGGSTGTEVAARQAVYQKVLSYARGQSTLNAVLAGAAVTWMDETTQVEPVFNSAGNYIPSVPYPNSGSTGNLSSQLLNVAALIASGQGPQFYHCQQTFAGYDTHTNQDTNPNTSNNHQALLQEFADAVNAFYTDLINQGLSSQVMILTYSEFGRRPAENSDGGTDHGIAGLSFVLGGAVRGGIYGSYPDLSSIIKSTNPVIQDNMPTTPGLEFYNVYATILERYLGLTPTQVTTLFPNLPSDTPLQLINFL
jgi:uncharacterized protein (DUF1501 family)